MWKKVQYSLFLCFYFAQQKWQRFSSECVYKMRGLNTRKKAWNITFINFPRGFLFFIYDFKRHMLLTAHWGSGPLDMEKQAAYFSFCQKYIDREKPEQVYFYPVVSCRILRRDQINFLEYLHVIFLGQGVKSQDFMSLCQLIWNGEPTIIESQSGALGVLTRYIYSCQRAMFNPWFFRSGVDLNKQADVNKVVCNYVDTFNHGRVAPSTFGFYGLVERLLRFSCRIFVFYLLFQWILPPLYWLSRIFLVFLFNQLVFFYAPAMRRKIFSFSSRFSSKKDDQLYSWKRLSEKKVKLKHITYFAFYQIFKIAKRGGVHPRKS